MHNIIDLDTMLGILGEQTLQITLRAQGEPFAHYIVKCDKEKVHYLDITATPAEDATVNITLDLEDLEMVKNGQKVKFGARMLGRIIKDSKFSSLVRGSFALMTALLDGKPKAGKNLKRGSKKKIVLPPRFLDDFSPADGWDPAKFAEIRAKGAALAGKAADDGCACGGKDET